MTDRKAWFDNGYEGKALRRLFTRLMKRFEKAMNDDSTDLDTIARIAHTLTLVAKCKSDLAKPENEYLLRLGMVEQTLGIGKKKTLGEFPVKTD